MGTNKQRLKQLENIAEVGGAPRIAFSNEGEDFVTLDGVQLSRAEWERIRTGADMEVMFTDEEADNDN